MKHFMFIEDLFSKRLEPVQEETDFLGFEAFSRPNERNDSSTTTSAPDNKEISKAA